LIGIDDVTAPIQYHAKPPLSDCRCSVKAFFRVSELPSSASPFFVPLSVCEPSDQSTETAVSGVLTVGHLEKLSWLRRWGRTQQAFGCWRVTMAQMGSFDLLDR
jgi:hypothetical protein